MCHLEGDTVGWSGERDERRVEMPGSGRTIPTLMYGPAEDARPAVIVVHDVGGVRPFYQDLSARLAEAGFVVALPDFFCREGAVPPNDREAIFERAGRVSFPRLLEDVRTIATELKGEGRQVGLVGFCMGGTIALLAAGRISELAATVAYYGFPVNAKPTENRPFNPIDEVERLSAPVLGLFGAEDAAVGPQNVDAYEAKAQALGKSIDFTTYEGVGHGFLTFDPLAPAAAASQDSWQRTLAFLREHLQTAEATRQGA